ncbi:DgyrCDS6550 [Dimorphilus gyrociliatus]|uniref:DgyrCDS6550 n=1 Tax=Dimorphilus gyrociliatus TaxID=2664684 RepID=A0A7I8VND5_9ANNE|nr:DgyrCDS6550 [Dimorphilus gyrociliatus]
MNIAELIRKKTPENYVYELLKMGKELGFNPNFKCTQTGLPFLQVAIVLQNEQAIEILLSRDANVNILNENNDTALHCASVKGLTNVCKILLSYGATEKEVNNQGRTPLMEATKRNYTDVIEVLKKGKTG